MLFKLKPVLQELDLGIIGDGPAPSVPYTLYDWLNEVDEEEEEEPYI